MHSSEGWLQASHPHLLVRLAEPGVAEVSFNRPEVINAFNSVMASSWTSLFTQMADDASLRVLVLRGEGRGFCSGADLKERNSLDDEAWHAQHRLFDHAFDSLRDLPVLTIAAVEGIAMGGGFELAMSCDVVVAAKGTRFSLPETKRGIIPGEGGAQVLARRVGPGFAKLLIATGREILAEEAATRGIVDVLCESAQARDVALGIANEAAQNAPLAVAQAKRAIDMGFGLPLKAAIQMEKELYRPLVGSDDRREGTLAFIEKRQPQFRGR